MVIDTPDVAETRPQAQTNQYSDIPVNIDNDSLSPDQTDALKALIQENSHVFAQSVRCWQNQCCNSLN